jgi:hypothetical protein
MPFTFTSAAQPMMSRVNFTSYRPADTRTELATPEPMAVLPAVLIVA